MLGNVSIDVQQCSSAGVQEGPRPTSYPLTSTCLLLRRVCEMRDAALSLFPSFSLFFCMKLNRCTPSGIACLDGADSVEPFPDAGDGLSPLYPGDDEMVSGSIPSLAAASASNPSSREIDACGPVRRVQSCFLACPAGLPSLIGYRVFDRSLFSIMLIIAEFGHFAWNNTTTNIQQDTWPCSRPHLISSHLSSSLFVPCQLFSPLQPLAPAPLPLPRAALLRSAPLGLHRPSDLILSSANPGPAPQN